MRYFFIILLFLGIAGISQADFFWRLPGKSTSILPAMGGSKVYATEVEVNGQAGVLEAYSFTGTTARGLSSQLARKFGIPRETRLSASGHFAVIQNGKKADLFVLPAPNGENRCVVLAFEQKSKPGAKNPQWPADFPALAAEPTFSAVCKKTRTALVQAKSPQAPQELLREAANALTQKGWLEATPQISSCRIFTYGRKHCILMSDREKNATFSTITLLQREGAEE